MKRARVAYAGAIHEATPAAAPGTLRLADGRVVLGRAAEGQLVEFLALLIDAEDADVDDVMLAARVHAARHVEVDLADVVQVVEVVEAPLDRFGDRDRLRVGERAEVAARAADDVG